MKTEMIAIDKLIPYERNAKLHPEEQIAALAKMFLEFGFDQNIVVDSDYVIIKGHGRRLAAIRAGMKDVPCTVRTDLTAAQIRASRIADNKIAETNWDDEKLNSELKIIEQEDAELLDKIGIEDAELTARLKSSENNWGNKDQDSEPKEVFSITVTFENDDDQQELFIELRDRGFKVKA